jgi:molecular chaperone GrpE (heat shock protein)
MTNNDGRHVIDGLLSSVAEEKLAAQQGRLDQLDQQVRAQSRQFDELVLDVLAIADILHELEKHFADLERTGVQGLPRKSVEVAVRRLLAVLRKHSVEPMNSAGQPLDLHRHEVVEVRQVRDQRDDIVLEEIVRGYVLRDRVLRHAKVVITQDEAAPAVEKPPKRPKAPRPKRTRSKVGQSKHQKESKAL